MQSDLFSGCIKYCTLCLPRPVMKYVQKSRSTEKHFEFAYLNLSLRNVFLDCTKMLIGIQCFVDSCVLFYTRFIPKFVLSVVVK